MKTQITEYFSQTTQSYFSNLKKKWDTRSPAVTNTQKKITQIILPQQK